MLSSSDKRSGKNIKPLNLKNTLLISACSILALAGEFWAVLTMIDRSDDLGIYRLLTGKGCIISPDSRYFITASAILLVYLVILFINKFSHITESAILKNCPVVLRKLIMNYIPASGIVICAIIVSFLLKDDVFGKFYTEYKIAHLRNDLANEKFIIHACGNLSDGDNVYTYTNSVEALVNSYNKGNTFVEVDFLWTSDKKLVCAHNEDSYWAYGFDFTSTPTLEEFLGQKFMGKYTSMDLDFLASFMRQHPDLMIVADSKSNILDVSEFIAENYPDLTDRFIMQIYHISEYTPIHNMGFIYIIYTLYRAEAYEKTPATLISNTEEYDLVGITFKHSWINKSEFFYELSENVKVPLFVHTVDNPDKIDSILERGVYIYTGIVETN